MSSIFINNLVKEKHKVQREILKEANNDLKKYTDIVKKEAAKLRKQFPGKFPQASHSIIA